VLRLNLLGLGLLLGADRFGGPRLPTVHTAVGGTHEGTIAARRTFASHTLAGLLTGRPELGDFLAKLGDFGEQGIHWEGGLREGREFCKKRPEGRLRQLTTSKTNQSGVIIVTMVFY